MESSSWKIFFIYEGFLGRGLNTTYGPTKLHERSLEIASSMLGKVESNIKELSKETLPSLEKEIKELGVPYIMGQGIEENFY